MTECQKQAESKNDEMKGKSSQERRKETELGSELLTATIGLMKTEAGIMPSQGRKTGGLLRLLRIARRRPSRFTIKGGHHSARSP